MSDEKENKFKKHDSGTHVIGMPVSSVMSTARDILNPSLPRVSEEVAMRFSRAAKLPAYRSAFTREQLMQIDQARTICDDILEGVSLLINSG